MNTLIALTLLIAAQNPGDEETAKKLTQEAQAALDQKDYAKAGSLAADAVNATRKDYGPAWLVYGKVDVARGEFWEAYRKFNIAREAMKGTSGEVSVVGPMKVAVHGMIAGIDSQIAGMKERGEDPSSPRLRQVQLHSEIGEFARALEILTALIGTDDASHYLEYRGDLHREMKRNDLALADYRRHLHAGRSVHSTFKKLMELFPDCPDEAIIADCGIALSKQLYDYRPIAWKARAGAYERRKEFGRAAADYALIHCYAPELPGFAAKFREMASTSGVDLRTTARELADEGKSAFERKQYGIAAERCRTSLALAAEDFAVRMLFARALGEVEEDDEAVAVLQGAVGGATLERDQDEALELLKAIAARSARRLSDALDKNEVRDDVPSAQRKLVTRHVISGDLDAAVKAADSLVSSQGTRGALAVRAQVHDLRGNYALALADYRAAIGASAKGDPNWVALHRLQLQQKDYDAVIADCRRFLRKNPDDRQTSTWLMEALHLKGDFKTALQEIERAMAASPGDGRLLVKHALILGRAGEWARMREDCLEGLRLMVPGIGEAALLLARHAVETNTEQDLKRDATDLADNVYGWGGHLLHFLLLYSCGEDTEALRHKQILTVGERLCDDATFRHILALMHVRRANFTLAIEVLRDIVRSGLDRDWTDRIALALRDHGEVQGDLLAALTLGTLLCEACPSSTEAEKTVRAQRRWPEERKEREEEKRRSEEAKRRAVKQADDSYRAGRESRSRGDLQAAAQHYIAALNVVQDHVPAAMSLSVIFLIKGEAEKAQKTLHQALIEVRYHRVVLGEKAPDSWLMTLGSWDELARQHLQVAGPVSARDAYLRVAAFGSRTFAAEFATELTSEMIVVWPDDLDLRQLRLQSGWHGDRAILDARKCVELRPKDLSFRLQLSSVLSYNGDSEGAFAEVGKAIEEWSGDPRSHLHRAQMFYDRWTDAGDVKDLNRALEDATRARGAGETARVFWVLSHIHEDLGDSDKAFDCADQLYRLDPAHPQPSLERSRIARLRKFGQKMREANAKGAAIYEERRRAEAERKRAAAEELAREAEARRKAAAAEKPKDFLDELSQAFRDAGRIMGTRDQAFDRSVQANREGGAALQRAINADLDRAAHVHEIERRFGYYSKSATLERQRR